MYAVGVPAAVIPLVDIGHGAWAFAVLGILTAITIIYFARLDENKLPHAHVETVISHRTTNISRIAYMAIIYAAMTGIEAAGWGPAWTDYGVLWVIPLFTTFPLFMIGTAGTGFSTATPTAGVTRIRASSRSAWTTICRTTSMLRCRTSS